MNNSNQMPGQQLNSAGAVGGVPPVNGVPSVNGMPPVVGPDGRLMVQQPLPQEHKGTSGLVKTIVIIALALVAVTFIGLFIWMTMQYNEERSRDLDSEIAKAVAAAKDEQAAKMEEEFAEREKYPFKTFAGPIDYGELTFEYPKTWSVYVAAAATAGGDFNAYFNPVQVDAVGKDTINALRVSILTKSFEEVTEEYQKKLEDQDSDLTVESVTVAGTAANRYTGNIPDTDLSGIIVIFKIRDKTVVMQTDSMVFKDDFDKLLETVHFNA
ncbi:hypothetical protein IKG60_00365 [Candidatus Saccharibacteria bacterium]|nr:hypothetical protein [Candidatus Saccharibacteria bacterium]